MLYTYKALNQEGGVKEGTIDTITIDSAISALQKQGLIISFIKPVEDKKDILSFEFNFFSGVSNKDIVVLSRQMATLFDAQVSALRIFRLIGGQVESVLLRKTLAQVSDDLQGGLSISASLGKHPKIFSDFYVNMVRAGEESGKLDETFNYLADYLDRTYEVTAKAKNALVYPIFVIATFFGVMILMLTVIIPKIGTMIKDSGQEVPFYTKIVLAFSDFFVHYGIFLGIGVAIFLFGVYKYSQTSEGARYLGQLKLELPYLGDLYRKLYLSRIADNMNTMILSGIPMLRALEITSSVVDNEIYKNVLDSSLNAVKGGMSLSNSFAQYDQQIPGIMVQMIKVGEETGELGNILKTLAKFYQREVTNAVDTLVGLIEPIMIVSLGLGVGVLLASVLMPIYNIASAG
ncbi:MAG: type II secretion system F family protein [Candidatus Zambryskibacteria bacterium]|nr:type II secretion system F family protein [Candidatus Zambryskibacteria bacterium]